MPYIFLQKYKLINIQILLKYSETMFQIYCNNYHKKRKKEGRIWCLYGAKFNRNNSALTSIDSDADGQALSGQYALTVTVHGKNDGKAKPRTISDEIAKVPPPGIEEIVKAHKVEMKLLGRDEGDFDIDERIRELEEAMHEAAEQLDFEEAATLRDRIMDLQRKKQGKPPRKGRGMRRRR